MAQAGAGCLLSACRDQAMLWKTRCAMRETVRSFARQTVPSPMRHFLLLSPLGMLLLASCGPNGGSSDAGDSRRRNSQGGSDSTFPPDTMTHTQISAQDSVGRSPLPRNLVATVEDICPVHQVKMKLREIPIVFEEPTANGTASVNPTATAAFPFGAEKIISAGNALLPSEPLTARVYQCASCIAARRIAEEKRKQPPAPTAPE